MRTRLERAAELLTDFVILHAALCLTERIDTWKGARPMIVASNRARRLLVEIGFPEGLKRTRKKRNETRR